MKQTFLKSAALLLVAGLFLFSCKKDDEIEQADSSTASDNANAQGSFDDMAKVSEDALNGNGGARLATPGAGISCATVDTVISAGNTKTLTITFTGGACSDGKVRSGTITAQLVGATYNTAGAVLTLTTSNYYINGTKVEGKKVITCVTGGANPVHDIVVSDVAGTGYAQITYVGGKTATWKSKRTRTLVSGGGDFDITNNIYDISSTTGIGNPVAEGVNKEGKSYSVDIVSPIRVDFSCFANNTARYPTQGVFKVTPEGKQPMSIDYGQGTCDNNVKITYLGKTIDYTLSY